MQHRFGHSTSIMEVVKFAVRLRFSCRIKLSEMENCTGDSNCTGQDVDRSVFEAYGFLVAFVGGLSLSLNVPTIVALCTARVIAKGLRMCTLISTLVSGILISMSIILTSLIALETVFFGVPAPPPLLCCFIIWVINNIGQSARCFSVVGFSIMVLLVVRYGKKNMKVTYLILFCSLFGAYPYFFPTNIKYHRCMQWVSLQVQSVSQLKMTPSFTPPFSQCTYWWLFKYHVLPLSVCIAVPIVVLTTSSSTVSQ